jgi:Mn2+/Fe2+ NRAMP family transporter
VKKLAAVLFWSVIAAAFIGPGTVTTAARSGAEFGYSLLWALVFSTVACLVLQEASARLTVVSGRNLGEALRDRYPSGVSGALVLLLVLGAVVLGCAAYEAGNILGGVAGASLALPIGTRTLTLISVAAAAGLLWFNSPRRVALLLSVLVALMGVAFVWTALGLEPRWTSVLRGSLLPSLPAGSALLAIGLVGTTVVPYNLFLGSGIAAGQKLSEVRLGLTVAVGLGGLISMAVLVVGSAVSGEFSFEALAAVLEGRLGTWAGTFFALGLFAAGLSSAVTAPLAAAITARSLFASVDEPPRWSDRSWRYRAVWGGVLGVGLAFGVSGVQPIPVIVLAQALNGLLLPIAAVFLLLSVNDRRLMGPEAINGPFSNVMMALVTAVAVVLGAVGVVRAAARAAGSAAPEPARLLTIAGAVALVVALPVAAAVRRHRTGQ